MILIFDACKHNYKPLWVNALEVACFTILEVYSEIDVIETVKKEDISCVLIRRRDRKGELSAGELTNIIKRSKSVPVIGLGLWQDAFPEADAFHCVVSSPNELVGKVAKFICKG